MTVDQLIAVLEKLKRNDPEVGSQPVCFPAGGVHREVTGWAWSSGVPFWTEDDEEVSRSKHVTLY